MEISITEMLKPMIRFPANKENAPWAKANESAPTGNNKKENKRGFLEPIESMSKPDIKAPVKKPIEFAA
jgi:hypothetical protein